MMAEPGKGRGVLVWALIAILGVIGLILLSGGVELIAQGGSPYYLLAGLAVLASAWGLLKGRRLGLFAYGALLIATVPWSLWEVGFDGWALAPRLFAPAVLGLALLFPAVRRAAGGASRWWVGAPLLAIVAVFAVAIVREVREYGDLPGAQPIQAADASGGEWRDWGHDLTGKRYSPLSQINTANVGKLAVAWTYDSPVPAYGGGGHGFEATPLAIDDRLYVCLDRNVVAALDQETGRELWRFDPHSDLKDVYAATCRGVAYYAASTPQSDCQKRVLFGTSDARLIALDAATGRPCSAFANKGTVNLLDGLGPVTKGYAYPTSPPTIVNGVVVVGQWIADGMTVGEPSGVIRGYDAVTGALRWAWDADRPDRTAMPPAGETYSRGTPNAWGVFSADPALGLVYLGTGSSTPDYFGAHRTPASEKYGSSVVAIDVTTGKVRWSFQTTHHDVWDYDIASQPVLADIDGPGGTKIPAVIATTKRAQLFVLDRRTGVPIDKVIEKPVPHDAPPHEWLSPTQPYTTGFPSAAGPILTEADMWGLTPLDQLWCRIAFKQARYDGHFTPQGLKPVITYPGSGGGSNWGSSTVDPDRQLLIVNTLHAAELGRLIPRAEADRLKAEAAARAASDKSGVPKAMQSAHGGQYTYIQPQEGTPYAFQRAIFLSPLDALCQRPPYGRISVFDIRTRKLLWSHPLGTIEHSGPLGIQTHLPIRMGVPTIGGSMASAGGLLFIGASQDRHFRAYDIAAGRILWDYELPTSAAATPMTYRSKKSGRQFVVIAAGSHPALKGPPAGRLYAFALPAR
jgi:membrane-bound PQQ-dependent dehydrogenase (glucose/quinate/shikimate family)